MPLQVHTRNMHACECFVCLGAYVYVYVRACVCASAWVCSLLCAI